MIGWAPSSPSGCRIQNWIDTLLRSSELQVLSIKRADAFAIRYPFLQSVRFPEGGHDLRANIPDQDLQLLAATAQLIVSDLFPPALADLLLQAAKEIHGRATPFSSQGEFPRPDTAPLPLSRAADNFYTDGPPKLQKYLPFRLATWVDRFLAALVAIASAAITIFNIIPALISLPFRAADQAGIHRTPGARRNRGRRCRQEVASGRARSSRSIHSGDPRAPTQPRHPMDRAAPIRARHARPAGGDVGPRLHLRSIWYTP